MKKFIFPSENRLCVHFPSLLSSISQEIIDKYLTKKGFEKTHVDIISLARKQIGKEYCRGAKSDNKFDCSSLMQWLYGQKGIYIPRISIDQREFGETVFFLSDIRKGDLLFTTGHTNYYWESNESNRVGHVGIYTGENTVIHAANKIRGVVEDNLSDFLSKGFRGITRFHDYLDESDTLIIPEKEKVEYDLHLRWRILQTL